MPKVLHHNRTPYAKSASRRHAMALAMNNRGSCGRELIVPYGNQQILNTSQMRRDGIALALQNRYVPQDCHCWPGATEDGGFARPEVFTDDFNRANTGVGLGPNWVFQGFPNSATMAIIGNQMLMQGSISAQMHARALYPDGLFWNDVGETTFSQFVQAQFIGAVGTARGGPALFLNGTPTTVAAFILGAAQGYMLQIAYDAGSVFIIRLDDNGAVDGASGSIATPAVNDVWEFQGDVTPTEVTLRVWQNGTLAGTRVDTAANRVTSAGWPGFASGNQTTSQTWEDFETRRTR